MKIRILKIYTVIIINLLSYCSIQASDYERINDFIKVWGYCKYYHPSSVRGDIDIDSLFIDYYNKYFKDLKQLDENEIIRQFLNVLGPSNKINYEDADAENIRKRIEGLINSTSYSLNIKGQLLDFNTPNDGKPIFVEFEPKVGNPTFLFKGTLNIYPNEASRVLGVANFWNVIYYYYPYYDLLPYDWTSKLELFVEGCIISSPSPPKT